MLPLLRSSSAARAAARASASVPMPSTSTWSAASRAAASARRRAFASASATPTPRHASGSGSIADANRAVRAATLARASSLRSADTDPATAAGEGVTAFRSVETAVNDILYGAPPPDPGDKNVKRHILSVLVDNEPGVLSKVSGMLSARGFNIESLSVCSTDVADLSRMTIVLQCQDRQMAQARHQLEDIVSVWAVLELAPELALEREMLLCKIDCVPVEERRAGHNVNAALTPEQIRARHEKRKMASEIATFFGGRVVNVGTEHVIVEVVESSDRIDAVLALFRPLGIIEAVRSGALAMSKSVVSGLYADVSAEVGAAVEVDDSALPPG